MTNVNQDDIFANYEGDNWFKRNQKAVKQRVLENDLPLKIMNLYNLKPKKVLEIGGANGYRLAAIREKYGTERLTVVEPSKMAIQEGQLLYPFIEFIQGLAHDTILEEKFDLIILHGVFHWVGRSNLLLSVANIDRLLEDLGFLIIGDFLPANRCRVPYHHLPVNQVYTYKQNYTEPFLSSGLYRTVCMLTYDHSTEKMVADIDGMNCFGAFLLQKTMSMGYLDYTFVVETKENE